MIEQKYFRLSVIVIICISVLAGVLSHFQISYQFYVWELFIDTKIIALLFLLLFLYKKKAVQFTNSKLLLLNWSWAKNIYCFFFPLFLYAVSIIAGILFKEVSLNKIDNAPTLILATVFDIPAIFVFSATSILIEEFFFRGFILTTIQQLRSQWQTIILTNLLWVVFSISEIIGSEEISLLKFITVALFFLSIGILCTVLVGKYTSIWFGYSLRVGFVTLSPIIVTSLLSESDVFFTTESFFFNAEGLIISVLILTVGFILLRTIRISPKILEEKFEI